MDLNAMQPDVNNIVTFLSVLAATNAGNVIINSTFVNKSPLGLLQCFHRCQEYSFCLSIYYSKSKLECRLNYNNQSLIKYVPYEYDGFHFYTMQQFQQHASIFEAILHIQENSSTMSCSANQPRIILKTKAFTCIEFTAVESGTVNVALNKHTEQSSIYAGGVSSRAVDGDRNSEYRQRSCTHTDSNKENWWRVDLAGLYSINKIQIRNRGNGFGHRLNNFGLYIGFKISNMDIVGFYDGTATDAELITFNFIYSVKGRHVKIVNKATNAYTLCEVEVYGVEVNL